MAARAWAWAQMQAVVVVQPPESAFFWQRVTLIEGASASHLVDP